MAQEQTGNLRLDRLKSRSPALMESLDVRILYAAVDELQPGEWNYASLLPSYWRLYQHDCAGAALILPSGEHRFEPGSVYLIPSDLKFGSRNDSCVRQFFIHFHPVGISPLLMHELVPGPVKVPDAPHYIKSVAEVGSWVSGRGNSEIGVQCAVKGIVFEAFGRYFGDLSADVIEKVKARTCAIEPVMPALRRIQENLASDLANGKLARLCAMSEDHFIRTFAAAVGLPPARYVQKQRVARAAQMLLFSEKPIEQIAEETGFGDRFYLSRVFAREAGQPPARYRKRPKA